MDGCKEETYINPSTNKPFETGDTCDITTFANSTTCRDTAQCLFYKFGPRLSDSWLQVVASLCYFYILLVSVSELLWPLLVAVLHRGDGGDGDGWRLLWLVLDQRQDGRDPQRRANGESSQDLPLPPWHPCLWLSCTFHCEDDPSPA